MIMHAFLEIIYKLNILDCTSFCVSRLYISLHDCTTVNASLPNIVADGYSVFSIWIGTRIIDCDSYKELIISICL